ncbi:MAG TPA: hypothetical protein VGK49_04015 [Ilumatobacteraceae bacterium]
MAAPPATSITIHSSWRGIILTLVGSLIVLGLGLLGLGAAGEVRVIPVLFLVFGTLFLLVALFDYPVATRFDSEGVHRRSILRLHTIRWDDVRALTRTRPKLLGSFRGLSAGGLAAVVGKRRYLLVDQPESEEEFDTLEEVIGAMGEPVFFDGVVRPGRNAPTWLYRRAKWRSPGAQKRR